MREYTFATKTSGSMAENDSLIDEIVETKQATWKASIAASKRSSG